MEQQIKLVDVSGAAEREQAFWPTVVLPRAAIEAEVERLASIPRPANGRRAASINHPMNSGPVPSFAPGIDVHIEVLKPGEKTDLLMRNSSRVDIWRPLAAGVAATGKAGSALRRLASCHFH